MATFIKLTTVNTQAPIYINFDYVVRFSQQGASAILEMANGEKVSVAETEVDIDNELLAFKG